MDLSTSATDPVAEARLGSAADADRGKSEPVASNAPVMRALAVRLMSAGDNDRRLMTRRPIHCEVVTSSEHSVTGSCFLC